MKGREILKDIIKKCFEEDDYKDVLVDKTIPKWFYLDKNKEYSRWTLVEIESTELEIIMKQIKEFEDKYLVKLPFEWVAFITLFWKEEIVINREDMDYYLFKNLPGKELEELENAMKSYEEFGTLPNAVPIGIDECGNWLLIHCQDGSIWVEDTDFEQNIFLSPSLTTFLQGEAHRFKD